MQTFFHEDRSRVEYTLRELGRSLRPILDSMSPWGNACQQRDIRQTR